jgi:hypothetical protein
VERIKRIKWIFHPIFKTISGYTTTEKPVEHADLFENHSSKVAYDDVHKGNAFLSEDGTQLTSWWQANRTEEKRANAFYMAGVEAHLKKKYSVTTVIWCGSVLECVSRL